MGLLDRIGSGLDKVSSGLDKMNAGLDAATLKLQKQTAQSRVGDVADSVAGPVRHRLNDDPVGIVFVGQQLPEVLVPFTAGTTSVQIGPALARIELGSRGHRRSTHIANASLGENAFEFRPVAGHRSELRLGDSVLAVVTEDKTLRHVRWQVRPLLDHIALAHALIAFAGIGADGAIHSVVDDAVYNGW